MSKMEEREMEKKRRAKERYEAMKAEDERKKKQRKAERKATKLKEAQAKQEMIDRNHEQLSANREQRDAESLRKAELHATRMEKARLKALEAEKLAAAQKAEAKERRANERAAAEAAIAEAKAAVDETARLKALAEEEEKRKMQEMANSFMEETARNAREAIESQDKTELAAASAALDRTLSPVMLTRHADAYAGEGHTDYGGGDSDALAALGRGPSDGASVGLDPVIEACNNEEVQDDGTDEWGEVLYDAV